MMLTAFWDYNNERWFNYDTFAYDSLSPIFRNYAGIIAEETEAGSTATRTGLVSADGRVSCRVTDDRDTSQVADAVRGAMVKARKLRYPHYAHEWDSYLRSCLRLLVCRVNENINYVFLNQHATPKLREILNSTVSGKMKCVTTAGSCSYVALDDDTATLLTVAGVPLIEITQMLRDELQAEQDAETREFALNGLKGV